MEAAVSCTRDADGVAVLLWTGQRAFGPSQLEALSAQLDTCLADRDVVGVVLAGERSFFGELNLEWVHAQAKSPDALLRFAQDASSLAARIEGSTKPIAAAIGSDAKGVGLEIALACHRRSGAAGAGYAVGFTDARYGLPPAFGTGPRLSARVGAERAVKLLGDATALTPSAALKAGLVDELVDPATLLQHSSRWVAVAASTREQRPLDAAIARSVREGPASSIDTAAREFANVARGPVAQDMVRTLGLSVAKANRLASRPAGIAQRRFARVGVLGAGLMGGGIALVCARAGLQVTLVDMSEEAARRGLDALAKHEASGVAAGRLDASESQATLGRIRPTSRYEDLDGVDIVVEAVFEDREVKATATRQAEAAAGPRALFATNTSTLPITGLAEASQRPESFIGLHFFSPVPRMPLLEIIRGKRTTDETLAHAMDFARAIGKTPIVVNDARGFYTTRVVMAYQAEAFDMLAQGADPEVIEAGGVASGMPVPPLALSDAVALDLIHQINLQATRDLGDAYSFTPGYRLVGRMVEQLGRKGKKVGHGFYEYGADGSRAMWPGLREWVGAGAPMPTNVRDARDRLIAAQALETVRCLEEGVITDPSQCDVGAILGWGFAPWTGGPLSWIDRMGVRECVARCEELAARNGSTRLRPPAALKELARSGTPVYGASWTRR
jgi:3-hydroxyacyl-CoA dehydrogenase/enoyl-CoA hydratase/3-hydroxybutyryl-CoA epimerase